MTIDFSQDYFKLFGMTPSFKIDRQRLAENYRNLQQEMHPDKFVDKSAGEQRLAVQHASHINSAYQTLKSPLLTAEYLLELAGHPVNKETLTIENNEFLFKQMQWREILSDLEHNVEQSSLEPTSALEQLQNLNAEVMTERDTLIEDFEKNYSEQQWMKAVENVSQWYFVEKMQASVEDLEDRILE